ncbi:MAG TPA: hypothetical protein VK152_03085 [Paludibacter sp.]|nr:hypothetical protein [Paludibacter sp.]
MPTICNAQNSGNLIKTAFIKETDSLKTAGLHFNVFRIHNLSGSPVTGQVSFKGPQDWKIIAFPFGNTTINPGDSLSVPVRIAPVQNAVGGISYILTGTFSSSDRQYSSNAYLTLPASTKWDLIVNTSLVYLTETSPSTTFRIELSNKGNTNEVIRLDMKPGKLLNFNNNQQELTHYIQLPAYHDTTITQTVTSRENLSYSEKQRYLKNWKESSVTAVASGGSLYKSSTIIVKKMSSSYINDRSQSSTPLNIDYQVYNLMSSQEARSNLKLYGNLLFPKNRSIEYFTGFQNIPFHADPNFDTYRQLLYSLRYADRRNDLLIGYNVNGGNMHTINGRGLSGVFRISKLSKFSYALTQNPYNNTLGEYAALYIATRGLSLNAEITHENMPTGAYKATSVLFGLGLNLFRHHTVQLQAMGSKPSFTMGPGMDTSVVGFSYKLSYNIKYKDFNLRFNATNSDNNYIRNSGMQHYYLDTKYQLGNKVSLSLYGNRQRYATTRYPYNFYYPVNYNSSDYVRLSVSFASGIVNYQFGPTYNGSMRQFYNSLSGYRSQYDTYQPGFWGSATFRLNGYRSITPNFTVNNLRFNYQTKDPALVNYSMNKNFTYSAGISYFDMNWRVNAYYSSGSTSDLYRSIQVDEKPVLSSSIQFRPSYENYYFNRKLKLSLYVNYAYYMPSGRENVSYNLKTDLYLKNGLTLYASGFMYSNVRVDKEAGRIGTKDLNLIVGISKSFNIQQPRQKYYNLNTVFFNDLDGNRMKSPNEPPVSDILVNIQKDMSASTESPTVPETQLLSDVNGRIYYENLPKDRYNLSFQPLVNLQSFYFLDGSNQKYYCDKSRTVYIPLVESYKIKGRIILVRDPNSNEGNIDMGGIRVTAKNSKGENYSALTDNFGTFILNVPNAGKYTVHVNNVFGEQFYIDMNETQVQFTTNKTINLDFTFVEKKRGINFGDGGELFNFKSLSKESQNIENAETEPNTESTSENEVQTSNPHQDNKPAVQAVNKTAKSPTETARPPKPTGKPAKGVEKSPVTTAPTPATAIAQQAQANPPVVSKASPVAQAKEPTPTRSTENIAKPQEPVETKPAQKEKTMPVPTKQAEGNEAKAEETPAKPMESTTPEKQAARAKGFWQTLNESKSDKGIPYMIQLDAITEFRKPSYYKLKYGLPNEVLYTETNGVYKYYIGSYPTIEAARNDIARYGLSGYIVQVDMSLLKK